MADKKAQYKVPNSSGGYDTVHFETTGDMVLDSSTRKLVNAAEKTFLQNHVNYKIVVSTTQPAAEAGVTIIWIEG